ncbi:hypothetical protein TPENAI_60338 [Tenacibaculum litopenaei]|uniref:hypothetical protein n=1 Tax=Tenacibaculum litopenaei TaxID=396016 RepID=UPI003895042B
MKKEEIRKLLVKVFNTLEKDSGMESINSRATYFNEEVMTSEKYREYKNAKMSSRTLINYYNKYVKDKNNNAGIPSNELLEIMKDYSGYVPTRTNKPLVISALGVAVAGIIVLILEFYPFSSPCVVWDTDRFVYVNCSHEGALNIEVNHIIVDNFRKVTLTPDSEFFIGDQAQYWYGKNASGEIEFFTEMGVHPETLKKLKPITEYVIKEQKLLKWD